MEDSMGVEQKKDHGEKTKKNKKEEEETKKKKQAKRRGSFKALLPRTDTVRSFLK